MSNSCGKYGNNCCCSKHTDYLGIHCLKLHKDYYLRFCIIEVAEPENVPFDTFAWRSITKTRLFKYIENFTTKNENFQIKKSGNFIFLAHNIDCGFMLEPPRRGGSNEYPQSMFFSRNKKINVYPCKPQFYCIKVGFKGVKTI